MVPRDVWLSDLLFSLGMLGALGGCAKEPLQLPKANHSDAAPRALAAEPATSAGSAGAFVYRGVIADAAEKDKPPPCPTRGAPYPSQVESVLLRSALTPFVRVELDGYVRTCLDRAKVEVQTGDAWREVVATLPRKPGISLDGAPLAGEMCDVVSCMKIERPLCVPLVELEQVDPQSNAYKSRPLRGEVRIHFPYYTDSECQNGKVATHRVLL